MLKNKTLLIVIISVFVLNGLSTFLVFTTGITVDYDGIGVDSRGVVYIGKRSVIEKYQNGKLIGSFSARTSRGYSFIVKEDDTIVLSNGYADYCLDTDGNVLFEFDDFVGEYRIRELKKEQKLLHQNEPPEYKISHPLGRTTVTNRAGDILFKMPMFEFAVKLISKLGSISFFGLAVFLVVNKISDWNKKKVS